MKRVRKKLILMSVFLGIVVFIFTYLALKPQSHKADYKIGEPLPTQKFIAKISLTPTSTLQPTITVTPTYKPTVTTTPTKIATQTPSPTLTPTANIINCTDCTLAPVDKQSSLPQSYAPSVVAISISGGGYLTPQANEELNKMANDAATKGINISVVSSYRSYQTQVSTFEYWVQTEISKGYSRSEAETRANVYSAKPGHSEHQLGTTLDLKCATCKSFDNSAGNIAVYNYLKSNAHSFGFVVSYPEGKENLTGYTYEPWHIRYIGIELATELFNRNYLQSNSEYLAAFLREKFSL